MSYTTSGGKDRATRIAAVVLLHAAFGAAFLSLGGYKAIENLVDPLKPVFVPDDPLPPEPKPQLPEQTDEILTPVVPEPVVVVKNPVQQPDPPVIVDRTPTPEPGPIVDSTTAGRPPVEPPVAHNVEKKLALYDTRYNDLLQPNYPGSARALGQEGRVTIEVIIGTDGRVMEARLLESSGFTDLDSAALKHARKYWRFKPATEDGKPVISSVKRAILFKLDIQRG